MTRPEIFKSFGLFLVLAAILAAWSPNPAAGQGANDPQQAQDEVELRFADYEAKLNAILKTRRNEEKEFVAAVLTKVRAGEIPVPMMESSFLWVINNRPDTKYPFVYFERVLRVQAKLAKVEIPEFDYQVYSERNNSQRTRSN